LLLGKIIVLTRNSCGGFRKKALLLLPKDSGT
jgi:hypothetical protein